MLLVSDAEPSPAAPYTVGHLVIRAIATRDGEDELLGEDDLCSAEHAP